MPARTALVTGSSGGIGGAIAARLLQDPARAGTGPGMQPRVPPIGRFIAPEEIASLAAYLLSPAAAAITGQDIAVCGGASLPH